MYMYLKRVSVKRSRFRHTAAVPIRPDEHITFKILGASCRALRDHGIRFPFLRLLNPLVGVIRQDGCTKDKGTLGSRHTYKN